MKVPKGAIGAFRAHPKSVTHFSDKKRVRSEIQSAISVQCKRNALWPVIHDDNGGESVTQAGSDHIRVIVVQIRFVAKLWPCNISTFSGVTEFNERKGYRSPNEKA